MNNVVFRKTMKKVRKHEDIKLVTTERRRGPLVSGTNYHTKSLFKANSLAIESKTTEIVLNKPVYLGLSILELRKPFFFFYNNVYTKNKIN